jgi:hypothetical protein
MIKGMLIKGVNIIYMRHHDFFILKRSRMLLNLIIKKIIIKFYLEEYFEIDIQPKVIDLEF